jgi:serine/threonine protein kinase
MDIVIHILDDFAKGMAYLHQYEPRAIIHCDLKSDNILLDANMNAKICDFGIVKIVKTTRSRGYIGEGDGAGTVQYKAPEAFEKDIGIYSDVYSFGCIIWEILSGKRPWDGLDVKQIMRKVCIEHAQLDFTNIRSDSPYILISLMKQCSDYGKHKRPSFPRIVLWLKKLREE